MLTDDAEKDLSDILVEFRLACVKTRTTFNGVKGQINVKSLDKDCDDLDDLDIDDDKLADELDDMKKSCTDLKSLLGADAVCVHIGYLCI